MRTLDLISTRIRSKQYSDPNELVADICAAIAATSRQPSFDRGLSGDKIADVQGGTSLGVGDPSAGNISDVLVQNAQIGLPTNIGLGLRTRRQARIEMRCRDVPAMVTTTAVGGDTTVEVKIVGYGVYKSSDPSTGVETVGDPLTALADAGTDPDAVTGLAMTATLTGQPFVSAGSQGIQPPIAGQTIFVTLSEQWEVVTTWTRRFRKNIPTVKRVLKSQTATITNGLVNLVSS